MSYFGMLTADRNNVIKLRIPSKNPLAKTMVVCVHYIFELTSMTQPTRPVQCCIHTETFNNFKPFWTLFLDINFG